MEHADPETLAELEDLLNALRSHTEVKEHRPGYFYCKGKSLTHFHVDPSGLYADAKTDGRWVRLRVMSQPEKQDFLALIEREIGNRK